MSDTDELLDDLFHGCAISAFVDQSRLQQGWPDREASRQRAFRLYEEELALRPDLRSSRPPR